MRYGVSLLLRVALRIRFPSVRLQPLGHLSVFRINNLRAVSEQCSAKPSFKPYRSSMRLIFSGLRACRWSASEEL